MAEGFHDFVTAEVLTAANVDDYLMRQTIMRFADASARNTALSGVLTEGLVAYLKDIDAFTVYTGSAWIEFGRIAGWTAYTPTWSGVIGNGTVVGAYNRKGREISYRISLTYGSTSVSPGTQQLTLPTAPHSGYGGNAVLGQCSAHDPGVQVYGGIVVQAGGSTVDLMHLNGSGARVLWSDIAPFTFANGDTIFVNGTYESAA